MELTARFSYNAVMCETRGRSESDGSEQLKLEPLTERYNADSHGVIYQLLSNVIRSALSLNENNSAFADVRNIALSGGYGTGKSSVLCQLKNDPELNDDEKNNVCLFISLSSLNAQSDSPSNGKQGGSDQTDLIEKEIVKQLLYQGKADISHFRRLRELEWWKRLGYSICLGFVLLLLFVGFGLMNEVVHIFAPHTSKIVLFGILIALFVISSAVVYWLLPSISGHVQLSSVKAGSTSLAIKGVGEETYFDRYLDEIVYFFNKSKKQVVVFEDIDRFDNTQIFEDLKELNTILNQDPCNKGRAICFVYAVRDSIFDTAGVLSGDKRTDSAMALYLTADNIERANRTKFFDLIIPMVPFMSPTAAKGWISTEFKDDGIDKQLIRTLSRHVTDMRLIKNIHNEFVIFRESLIRDRGNKTGRLSLDVNRILAMVAYKNVYPRDFEKLRTGTSCLDDIYRFKLKILALQDESLRSALKQKQAEIKQRGYQTAASREYGEVLIGIINGKLESSSYNNHGNFTIKGHTFEQGEDIVYTLGFWSSVIDAYKADNEVKLTYYSNDGLDSRIELSVRYLSKEIVKRTPYQRWMESLDLDDQKAIKGLRQSIVETSQASMKTVIEESNWQALADPMMSESEKNLRSFVEGKYGKALGSDLIASGFISDDYQLYAASHEEGWLSNDGMNYVIHNLTQGGREDERSLNWTLTSSDCQAIYDDFGPEVASNRNAYNIQLLDWLLTNDPKSANNMLMSPVDYDDWDKKFYAAYLKNDGITECNRDSIVESMAGKSDKILDFLVGCQELNDYKRKHYVDIALRTIQVDTSDGKSMDTKVKDYLQNQDSRLTCMRDEELPKSQAKLIADYYADAEIRLTNLRALSPKMLNFVKHRHNYAVNRGNFQLAFDSNCDFSLNSIRERDQEEYGVILNGHLIDYVEGVNPDVTINGAVDEYSHIVRDVVLASRGSAIDERKQAALEELIYRSEPCEPEIDLSAVFDLEGYSVSDETDQLIIRRMAQCRLFIPTPSNIMVFLSVLNPGERDLEQDLISFDELLGYVQISEKDMLNNTEPADTTAFLATLILNSERLRDNAEQRVELVKQLSLSNDALDAKNLLDRSSTMFAKLVESDLIPENSDTFNLLESSKARLACIRLWDTLLEGAEIPANEIPGILSDSEVTDSVKEAIYADLPRFLTETDKGNITMREIIQIAGADNQVLSFQALRWIAERLFAENRDEVDEYTNESLIGLVHLVANSVSKKQSSPDKNFNDGLCSVLTALPGDYPKLVDSSSKPAYLPNNDDNIKIITAVKDSLNTIGIVKKLRTTRPEKLQCLKVRDSDQLEDVGIEGNQ